MTHNPDCKGLYGAEFDKMLQNSLPEPPPDDIVQRITPWRKAVNYILAGLAMSTITLNFLNLQYWLPAISMILLLLGFRIVRRENRPFRICYYIVILRALCVFMTLVLNATIYRQTFYDLPIARILTVLNIMLTFALLSLLLAGFWAVRQKAELPARMGSAALLPVWYVVICVLGLFQYQGLIIGLLLMVAYCLMLRSLYKLSKELDEAGYTIRPALIRISDQALGALIAGIMALGIIVGLIFFSKYPMEWSERGETQPSEVTEIQAQLVQLGFPEEVLADLSDEDILACDGALRVMFDFNDHPINDGINVTEDRGSSGIFQYTVYEVKELRMISVAVELPGEIERWKIFHYFCWTTDPGFYSTEAIQLWPAYRWTYGWSLEGDVSGQLLYDEKGITYTAPYYSLGNETYQQKSMLLGDQQTTDLFAAFSLPLGGENKRGYISYEMGETVDGCIIDSNINYVHQNCWWQYPVQTAQEYRMSGAWPIDGSTFRIVQDALQFFPSDVDEEDTFG